MFSARAVAVLESANAVAAANTAVTRASFRTTPLEVAVIAAARPRATPLSA